jgi:flagellar biosynthesis protein FlhF
MRVKKFYASSASEALRLIRSELGPDAMILQSDKVKRNGLLGFLKGPAYVVTAAVAEDEEPEMAIMPAAPAIQLELNRPNPVEIQTRGQIPELQAAGPESTSELQDIRASLKQMQEFIAKLSFASETPTGNGAKRPATLVRLQDLLLAQGLDDQLAQQITKQIDFELSRQAVRDWRITSHAAATQLERQLSTIDALEKAKGEPAVVFIVGPTGVGKTTIIAKLAARLAADKTKSVALATADTVRIGAIPQLQAYADIIGLPLAIIYSPADLTRFLETHPGTDVILVDTPACSPGSSAKVRLPQLVDAAEGATVLLALSATTRDHDAAKARELFADLPVHGLVVTKLDESSGYGPVFNLTHRFGLPLAYVTTGQSVPEDIETADARALASKILDTAK